MKRKRKLDISKMARKLRKGSSRGGRVMARYRWHGETSTTAKSKKKRKKASMAAGVLLACATIWAKNSIHPPVEPDEEADLEEELFED